MPIFDRERRLQRKADRQARQLNTINQKRKKNGFKIDKVVADKSRIREIKQRAQTIQSEDVVLSGQNGNARVRLQGRIAGIPDQVSDLATQVEDQAEAIEAISEQLDALAEAAAEAQADASSEDADELMEMSAASWGQLGIILEGGIGVINAGDVVHQPWALALAEAVEGYATSQRDSGRISSAEFNQWMLGVSALKGFAYYNVAQGLNSILANDSGGLINLGTTTTSTATLRL